MRHNFHYEVLPKSQRALWNSLQPIATNLERWGCYLAGGTALALQLGHRQSVDLDFFSQKPKIAVQIHERLQRFPGFLLREMDENTIHAELEGIKVSFIGAYKYPLVRKLVSAGGIKLASVMDIALMKFIAITHRATMRDYMDLAAIMHHHISLTEILKLSKKKYGKNFNVMMPLRAVVSFQDIEPEMPVLLDKELKNSWREILRDAVKQVTSDKR